MPRCPQSLLLSWPGHRALTRTPPLWLLAPPLWSTLHWRLLAHPGAPIVFLGTWKWHLQVCTSLLQGLERGVHLVPLPGALNEPDPQLPCPPSGSEEGGEGWLGIPGSLEGKQGARISWASLCQAPCYSVTLTPLAARQRPHRQGRSGTCSRPHTLTQKASLLISRSLQFPRPSPLPGGQLLREQPVAEGSLQEGPRDRTPTQLEAPSLPLKSKLGKEETESLCLSWSQQSKHKHLFMISKTKQKYSLPNQSAGQMTWRGRGDSLTSLRAQTAFKSFGNHLKPCKRAY